MLPPRASKPSRFTHKDLSLRNLSNRDPFQEWHKKTTQKHSLLVLKTQESSLLELLNHDVLHLILEQVFLERPKDLRNSCTVSRRLYVLSVPWLYRHVTIDFLQHESHRLLRRLLQEGSRLPAMIRHLELINTDKTIRLHHLQLATLLGRLTGLDMLIWDGFVNIPIYVLMELRTLRSAKLTIKATGIFHVCDLLNSGFYPSRSHALNHVVVRQLTSFYLSATWLDQYYGNFKIDLVNMLGSASSLKTLSIRDSLTGTLMPKTFQEDLCHMSALQLPQLQELEITTTVRVSTSRELAIWGKQGGWVNLKILALFHGDLFSSFPGQVPQLDQLRFYRHNQWDSQELETYMDTLPGSSLGPITRLQYVNGIYSWDLIPWFVLKRVCSTITELLISHHTFYDITRNVPAPTAQNIHHLRNICPHLRVLHVDIVLYDEDWEFDLLRQLSLFKEPIRLRLYIFQPNADDDDIWDFPTHSNCRRAFDYMAAERERQDLPMLQRDSKKASDVPSEAFIVEFKVVRPWEDMKPLRDTPEYTFWKCRKRWTRCSYLRKARVPISKELNDYPRPALTILQRVQALKIATRYALSIFKDSPEKKIKREQELRLLTWEEASDDRSHDLPDSQQTYGNDVTLYDLWTQGTDRKSN